MTKKKVLISGSSGFVGTELIKGCIEAGYNPVLLLRSRKNTTHPTYLWNPLSESLDADCFEGVDTVVHLSGENVADGYWTSEKKRKILESRVQSTRFLVDQIIKSKHKPSALLCSSAIGWYGDRGNEILDESSSSGRGFLPEVARMWEKEALRAQDAGVRVVFLRFGLILGKEGGAFPRILTPFRLGLGGPLGDGHQYMSWITIEDAIRSILFIENNPSMVGPVNITAPKPVTNRVFGQSLASKLARPFLLPTPAFALRLSLGDMARELLLASTRAVPNKLLNNGFVFEDVELEPTLEKLI